VDRLFSPDSSHKTAKTIAPCARMLIVQEERHNLHYCQILCFRVCVASGLQEVEIFDQCLSLEPRREFEIYPRVVGQELLVQPFRWALFEVVHK